MLQESKAMGPGKGECSTELAGPPAWVAMEHVADRFMYSALVFLFVFCFVSKAIRFYYRGCMPLQKIFSPGWQWSWSFQNLNYVHSRWDFSFSFSFIIPQASVNCISPNPRRRKWQPTLVLLPGKSHGLRSLAGYSPWSQRVRRDLVTKTLPPSLSGHTPWAQSENDSVFCILSSWGNSIGPSPPTHLQTWVHALPLISSALLLSAHTL